MISIFSPPFELSLQPVVRRYEIHQGNTDYEVSTQLIIAPHLSDQKMELQLQDEPPASSHPDTTIDSKVPTWFL